MFPTQFFFVCCQIRRRSRTKVLTSWMLFLWTCGSSFLMLMYIQSCDSSFHRSMRVFFFFNISASISAIHIISCIAHRKLTTPPSLQEDPKEDRMHYGLKESSLAKHFINVMQIDIKRCEALSCIFCAFFVCPHQCASPEFLINLMANSADAQRLYNFTSPLVRNRVFGLKIILLLTYNQPFIGFSLLSFPLSHFSCFYCAFPSILRDHMTRLLATSLLFCLKSFRSIQYQETCTLVHGSVDVSLLL
jgi:hypothetical protein